MMNQIICTSGYASKIMYLVIIGFNTNDESNHLHIHDHSVVTFGIKEEFLGFSHTSNVESFGRFRIKVVDKVKIDICLLKTSISFKRK